MNVTVSVIMPVYNAEKFLSASIKSVLDQSFTNFEFIIYNDGSSDKSLEIIQSFHDPRITLVHSEKNQGYLGYLNDGITRAKGKYIARMDADDIAYPERFARQVAFLEANPGVGACGTWAVRFTGNALEPETTTVWELEQTHSEIIKAGLMRVPLVHPTAMYSTDIVRKNGIIYRHDRYPAEDYQFWYDISKVAALANIPEVLLKYRDHGNNISKTSDRQQYIASTVRAEQTLLYFEVEASEKEKKALTEFLNRSPLNAIPLKELDAVLCSILFTQDAEKRTFARDLIKRHWQIFLNDRLAERFSDVRIFRLHAARVLSLKSKLRYLYRSVFKRNNP